MKEKFSLKDHLFNQTKVEKIANQIQSVYSSFQKKLFLEKVVNKFPELELKERIIWISECLKFYLPSEFKLAKEILIQSLPPKNDPNLKDNDFGDFIYAPYSEFIARYGCTKEYLNISLEALREITMRFSAEDAIRYFLNSFPKETLKKLIQWSKDKNYHVRRLCSEGTRPKLPWSQKINIATDSVIPILDNLFSDSTRFVTRSVANHLNDLSKIDSKLTIGLIKKYKQSKKQDQKEMEFITNHSLRTLIKQGNKEALKEIGFADSSGLKLNHFKIPKNVKMNSYLEFSFELESTKNKDVLIDYILYFQTKKGELNSKKVFKLKTIFIKKEKKVFIQKKHLLKQFMTTRTLYQGQHEIEIQINGKNFIKGSFLLNE